MCYYSRNRSVVTGCFLSCIDTALEYSFVGSPGSLQVVSVASDLWSTGLLVRKGSLNGASVDSR